MPEDLLQWHSKDQVMHTIVLPLQYGLRLASHIELTLM